jgi:hypothetical protein
LSGLTFTYPVIDIRPSYSMKKAQYPMIVVHEMDNRAAITLGDTERFSSLAYQIDVYCKDMVILGSPVSRNTIARSICGTVDSKMNSEYGMTRVSSVYLGDDDDGVLRYALRYTGFLDVINGILYRRGE